MALAFGVDLGGTKIEAVALGADGREAARLRVPTPAGDYDATLATIASLLARTEAAAGQRATRVGIGTPGTARADGLMKNCNSTCLNGRPLQRDLEALLQRPVRLANDANCLALSEATDGAGAGARVVFAAIIGTGTGAGLVVDGRLLVGPNGLAGEWGHNPLPWATDDERPGRACYCGRSGCIETWVSGPGLAADHAAHGAPPADAAAIARAAAAGDAVATATLERHAGRLARALAHVVNLVDPDVIVLGGGISNLDGLYERVPALWGDWVFAGGLRDAVRTRLVRSRHGDSSGVRGAAWLWNDAAAG